MEAIVVFVSLGAGRGWRWCVDTALHGWLGYADLPTPFLLGQLAMSFATGIIIGDMPMRALFAPTFGQYLRMGLLAGFLLSDPFIGEGALVRYRKGAQAAVLYLMTAFLGLPLTLMAGYFVGLTLR